MFLNKKMFTRWQNKKILSAKNIFCLFFVAVVLFSPLSIFATHKAYAARDEETRTTSTFKNTQATPVATDKPATKLEDASIWNPEKSARIFAQYIADWMLTLTAYVMTASAKLLNFVITYTVVNVKVIVENPGVTETWKTFRDLANMFFIFILLYAAISMILGTGGHDIKKLISRMVIVALLLNFSFFFTKVAVDASNILAITFYNQIIQNDSDIGQAFATKLGVTTLYSKDALEGTVTQTVTGQAGQIQTTGNSELAMAGKFLELGVFGSIFFLVLAFILLAASLMFTYRFITLIFLFILSPLAFVSQIVPDQEGQWKEWVKKLTKACIFAPAFMIAMWAVLSVFSKITLNNNLIEAILGKNGKISPSFGEILFNFAIVVGLAVGALFVADATGGYGAGAAIKMLAGARDWTQNKLKNTSGWAAQNTIGRAGLGMDKFLEKSGVDGRVGRVFREMTTGAVAGAKFGGNISRKDDKKHVEDLNKDIADKKRQRNSLSELDRHAETIEANKKIISGPGASAAQIAAAQTALDTAKSEAERILGRMSNKELESAGFKKILAHADLLSPEQFTHVSDKSDKFSEQEKAQIKEARFKNLTQQINTAGPNARKEVRALTDKEIELLEPSTVTNAVFIGHMSDGQVESALKSSKLTATQKKAIRDERARPFKEAVDSVPAPLPAGATPAQQAAYNTALANARARIATELSKMKPQKISKLDANYLTNEHVMSQLTPAMLSKMPEELDTINLQTIGNWIRTNRRPAPGAPNDPLYDYITNGIGRGLF